MSDTKALQAALKAAQLRYEQSVRRATERRDAEINSAMQRFSEAPVSAADLGENARAKLSNRVSTPGRIARVLIHAPLTANELVSRMGNITIGNMRIYLHRMRKEGVVVSAFTDSAEEKHHSLTQAAREIVLPLLSVEK
jgi:ribosomal protein L16/L10AE